MIISLLHYFPELTGIPCWHVQQGHGSFLTFEFGLPHQEIIEICHARFSISPKKNRRTVIIHGDWHLWIYCCGWRIFQEDQLIAHNESDNEEIRTACNSLDGQAIKSIELDLESMHTNFLFDLGGYLETGPYDNELNEQWYIYCPDGRVFTLRSDGHYSFESGESPGGMEHWTRLGSVGISESIQEQQQNE